QLGSLAELRPQPNPPLLFWGKAGEPGNRHPVCAKDTEELRNGAGKAGKTNFRLVPLHHPKGRGDQKPLRCFGKDQSRRFFRWVLIKTWRLCLTSFCCLRSRRRSRIPCSMPFGRSLPRYLETTFEPLLRLR